MEQQESNGFDQEVAEGALNYILWFSKNPPDALDLAWFQLEFILTIEKMFYPKQLITLDLDAISRSKGVEIPRKVNATPTEVFAYILQWNIRQRQAQSVVGAENADRKAMLIRQLRATAPIEAYDYSLLKFYDETVQVFEDMFWPTIKDEARVIALANSHLKGWIELDLPDFITLIAESVLLSREAQKNSPLTNTEKCDIHALPA